MDTVDAKAANVSQTTSDIEKSIDFKSGVVFCAINLEHVPKDGLGAEVIITSVTDQLAGTGCSATKSNE